MVGLAGGGAQQERFRGASARLAPAQAGREHSRGVADQQIPFPQQPGQLAHVLMGDLRSGAVQDHQARPVALLGRVLGDPVGGQLVVVLLEYERGRLAHGEGVSTNTWKSSGSATMES